MAQNADTTRGQGVSPEQQAETARRAAAAQDSSGDTGGGEETPSYSDNRHPGRSLISSIAARRRQELEAETGEDLSETGAPSGAEEGAEQSATQQDGTGQDAGTSATDDTGTGDQGETAEQGQTQDAVDPNTLVTVKIYGEEQQIPLWQLQRDYQVNQAGHRKLQEANQRLAYAQQLEQQLQQQPAPQQGQRQQPAAGAEDQPIGQPNQQERQQAATDQDAALQLANSVQFGDTNEAAQAIQQIMQQGRGQGDAATPDPNQIAQQVTQQVRDQMTLEHAVQTFANEYPEIFQDSYLSNLAADAANDLKRRALMHIGHPEQQVRNADPQAVERVWRQEQQRGVLPSDIQLFRAAGNEVRSRAQQWAQTFQGSGNAQGGQQQGQPTQAAAGQQGQPTGPRDEKRAAKRQQAAPATGQNQAAPLSEPEPQPRSGQGGQDTVEWLKKRRGQSM